MKPSRGDSFTPPADGAALLPVEVGEHRAFHRDPVDVGRPITHDTVVVATDIEPPDVVAHDEQNVRLLLLLLRHSFSLLFES